MTVIRYPGKYVPFAVIAMAIHRAPLLFNKGITFYKLMGSGRNRSFDRDIDWRQWAIFAVHTEAAMGNGTDLLKNLYGQFISKWLETFRCETFTLILQPTEGHGTWDGKHVFGNLPKNTPHDGLVAVLTRASIRLNRLQEFWNNTPPVSSRIIDAKGLLFSVGIGEIPLVKQATFSIWQSLDEMKAFAYGLKEHTDVIRKTRERDWYSEELFVRFRVTDSFGTIRGVNPPGRKNVHCKMKNIKLIEVPSEIGAGTRGACLGIDAIKIAALDFMSNFFVHFPSEKIESQNNLLFEPIQSPYAKRIQGIVTMFDKVSKAVSDSINGHFFPVVLSGDHSTSGGTIAGIKMAKPKSKLGVIWIDAHADLHTPYTTPTGNMHGMPLATAIGENNEEKKVHDLDEKTARFWEQLKTMGKIHPKVLPEDIVFISLRDYEKEEKYLIEKYDMKVITTNEVRRNGAESVSRKVLRYLSDCTDIYVSFDVDSLDSSISKGTGTPVSNGLKEREAEDLISKFMQSRKICCFEITEVNPTLDKENLMAEIAFNILQRSVNVLMMN